MATFTFTENYTPSLSLDDQSLTAFEFRSYGMTGLVTNVSFTLLGLSHTHPDDLDMLLIAPDGVRNLAFWSDAGGGTDLVNADITFSDSGAIALPDGAALTSGTYRPADYGLVETGGNYFYPGAVLHAGPNGAGTIANAFADISPNGAWQLRIIDDAFSDVGSLSGFQLTITSSGSVAALTGTALSDTLAVSETGFGSGYFRYNGQNPVAYSGVSGFSLDGGLGNDTISGSSGADILAGGGGQDFVSAGLGNDILVVRDGEVAFGDLFDGGGGNDTLRLLGSSANFSSSALVSIERVEFVSTTTGPHFAFFNATQFGSGISLTATIDGNASDTINDTLVISMGFKTSLNLSGLTMLDFSQVNDDVVIIVGDADAETIIGTSVRDFIIGNDGNDSLNGGLGIDQMLGGDGSDTYFANVVNDEAIEENPILAIGGYDTVNFTGTSGTFILSANVERLNLGGGAAINGTGNGLANVIVGNAAANILNGGVDTLADALYGGLGNDTYVINSAADNIVETLGQGTADRAKASVSFALAAGDNVEFLETTNAGLTTAINLTGNEIAQTITGNAGVNVLKGLGGKDVLDGLAGLDTADFSDKTLAVVATLNGAVAVNVTVGGVIEDSIRNIENLTGGTALDTLTGDGLANILNGGADAQADNLRGLLGNDTYVINSATDNIMETVGQGTADRAKASVSFTLVAGDNIEFLETTNAAGVGLINLTGNELAQTITGNAGANILNGGIDEVTDVLIGGLGNDTYIINNSSDLSDLITEFANGGTADVVKASFSFTLANDDYIEILQTTNAALTTEIYLTGNAVAQSITGNAGANILAGAGGNDTLTGGLGADVFLFNTAPNAATNRDVITDFNVAADTIRLDDAVFAFIGTPGLALAANLFKNLTTGGPVDADDRILYNDVTGAIFYDGDGSGASAAIQFATLTGAPTVFFTDFFVI